MEEESGKPSSHTLLEEIGKLSSHTWQEGIEILS
jgi:hypothetical protein